MMECGADREEKNSEAMSKSKTTARMVGGGGKRSAAAVRAEERKGVRMH